MDYYKNAYNITIKDPQQPLLLHRVRKKELKDQVGCSVGKACVYRLIVYLTFSLPVVKDVYVCVCMFFCLSEYSMSTVCMC